MRDALKMAWVLLALGLPNSSLAQGALKLGVLTDMSGPFSDSVGPGSVAAAELAIEDFSAEAKGWSVALVSADHQNKPDTGAAIARRWVDGEGVDAIVDLPNSGVALAVSSLMAEKNRLALASSSMTSDLTGKACKPTTLQWVSDTYAQGAAMTAAAKEAGLGLDWFFLSVDYALGAALVRDASKLLEARGGKVVGNVRHPLGVADFGSFLLQAQASGATTLALANTGADMVTALKQANEFGLRRKMRVAALFVQLPDVEALGLELASGLVLAEAFYWDMNDRTRAFADRFARKMGGRKPSQDHAGVYSATLAWARAARDAGTKDASAVMAQLKSRPIDDPLFGKVTIRVDGRALHDMHLFEVKAPAESRAKHDFYRLLATIPADKAFRAPSEDCALVK